jgi:hypothetical protein
MIIADVFVPSIDQVYNFSLDETVSVGALIEELISMIEQREQTTFAGNRQSVILVDKQSRAILPIDSTLYDCNVETGSALILV